MTDESLVTVEGILSRMGVAQASIDGDLTYEFMFEGDPLVYGVDGPLSSSALRMSKPGDRISATWTLKAATFFLDASYRLTSFVNHNVAQERARGTAAPV